MTGSSHLVDPELRDLLALIPTSDVSAGSLSAVRDLQDVMLKAMVVPDGLPITIEDRTVPSPRGGPDVRILLFQPTTAEAPRPAYCHMHGGGFIAGSADASTAANAQLAATLGCTIVSVDYRLAPETCHPGPVEDCYAALKWLHDNALELGIDTTRIAIGGESAGGGLGAALALLARDRGEVPIIFQRLIFPMIDDRTCIAEEPNGYAGEFVWTPGSNLFGWTSLLGHEPGGAGVSAYAAAARAEDLEGLPPAYIAVGALDLFVDENIDYAKRLIRAGVPTELHVYPGAYHGFQQARFARIASAAIRDSHAALQHALQSTD